MRGERVWLLEICPSVPAEVVANRTRAIVNQYFHFITRTPGPAQAKGVSSSRNQCAGKKPLIRRVRARRVGAQTQLLASEHFNLLETSYYESGGKPPFLTCSIVSGSKKLWQE